MTFGPLVTTDWLGAHIGEGDLKLVDASWRMPGAGDARTHYCAEHIPGAVFFDIDEIADQSAGLPHMLPEPAAFEAAMGALGLADQDRIVVYDDAGIFSAARVWWTFRAMGHERVAVLNGGLPKWLNERRPVTAAETVITPTNYAARAFPRLCAAADEVRAALSARDIAVIDARPAERFAGRASEPRAGLRAGHMPGARNLPHTMLIQANGEMLPPDDIRAIFSDISAANRIITSCGSGVTAAVLALALEIIGWPDYAVYDGSWTEWGKEENDSAAFPVCTSTD